MSFFPQIPQTKKQYTPEEVDAFLNPQKSASPSPQPTPTIAPTAPNYVNPLLGKTGVVTGTLGDGHYGEDTAYTDPNESLMTNPIGGTPFSGTIKDGYGNTSGYGNYFGVIGGSPEEQAQMTPEEKVRMFTVANQYMAQNPQNIQGLQALFPGKNINVQGHLSEPVQSGLDVATGSAKMNMGNTGKSTGTHLHDELLSSEGQIVPLSQMILKALQKKLELTL